MDREQSGRHLLYITDMFNEQWEMNSGSTWKLINSQLNHNCNMGLVTSIIALCTVYVWYLDSTVWIQQPWSEKTYPKTSTFSTTLATSIMKHSGLTMECNEIILQANSWVSFKKLAPVLSFPIIHAGINEILQNCSKNFLHDIQCVVYSPSTH